MKDRATELEYLQFFFQEADFGPAIDAAREGTK
jgi:hypothetical protein